MTPTAALLILHLLAAAFWVGGMATMHFAVRPAAVALLTAPPQRLTLLAGVLQRFFFGVLLSIGVLLGSGLALIMLGGGFGAQRPGVHAMFALGLVMMAVFGHIRWALFPRLARAVAKADWPAAGAAMNGIRQRVAINLGLGVAVFVLAVAGS